jgi:hypothetical protein
MADWKKVAKVAILGDGRIDTREVNILRDSLFADGSINKSELEFLQEIRLECKTSVKAFSDLFIEAVKNHLLADGTIDAAEAQWLRKTILADGQVDELEKKLLETLKSEARSTSPEFDALYAECLKKA